MVRAAGAALVMVLLVACRTSPVPVLPRGAGSPVVGGQVTEALVGGAIGPLNPLFQPDENAQDVDALIYQGLTEVGPAQQPVGLLATGWTESPDHLSYTFTLRPGVRWADGVPFTAADVMFTFSVLQSPQYQDPGAQYWKEVQVQELGPMRVRFTLQAPSASFPLIVGETGILPEHVFRHVPIDRMASAPGSGTQAIGTGPFRVQSISQDDRTITLARNPYARPRPYLARFVFRVYSTMADALGAVSTGAADTLGVEGMPSAGSLLHRARLRVLPVPTFDVVAVYLNLGPQQAGLFGSTVVRQALVEAVDRRQIVGQVLGGAADVAPGPIPPTSWAYSAKEANQYRYDPVEAAALLRQAGWVRSGSGLEDDGRPFSVTLATPDGYPYPEVAQAIATQLGVLGIQVRVQTLPAAVLLSQHVIPGDYQMAMLSIDNGPDPDLSSLWHSGLPTGSLNFSSAGLPHQALIDRDLDEGRMEMTRASRLAAYADFQNLIAYAAPAIFLFEPHYTYLVSTRVRGVRTNPAITPVERFEYVAGWYAVTQAA